MKKILILTIACLMSLTTHAQKTYTVAKDAENGAVVFKGPVTFTDLEGESSFNWLTRGESAYTPDPKTIELLRKELPAYSIVAVMGTWCEDSQNLMPKLSKTLREAGFPMQQYVMYGVDRSKRIGGNADERYNVKLVPTIIVYKGDREVGRIVEAARKSIEADLAGIVRGKQ